MISNNHLSFKIVSDVIKISEPIYTNTGCIKFSNYVIQYDNGSTAEISTHKLWARHVYDNYIDNPNNTNKRTKSGLNYWKKNTSVEISEMAEDARNNFNIDARIEFVYRDEPNKCYHMYSFYSDRKNADRAYNFYNMHTAKLINFIAYFNREASHLMAEANKPENLITIPNYNSPELPEKTRDFVTEMKAVGASINLGDRETEALLLYSAGYTAKQIGEMFHRSAKTIEKHIEHIKNKTGCKDRKDLHAYVHDIGLAGMERFFFNYFSHE